MWRKLTLTEKILVFVAVFLAVALVVLLLVWNAVRANVG